MNELPKNAFHNHPVLRGPGVTVSFSCEFRDAAREGECDGPITRAGGSLMVLRGMLKSAERLLFSFSAPASG